MFLSRVQAEPAPPESRDRSLVVRARPSFCVAMSLPLPIALPALARSGTGNAVAPEPAVATLQISFCSGGNTLTRGHASGCAAGCGHRDHGLTARLATSRRPAEPAGPATVRSRRARGGMRAAMVPDLLPSRDALARSWLRVGRRLASVVRDAEGAAPDPAPRDGRASAMPLTAVPDSFALAMQQWPISFTAFAAWQGAFVGILHFCDAIPGLPRPWHSSLRSRVTSADQRLLHYGRDALSQPFLSIRVSSSTRSWR